MGGDDPPRGMRWVKKTDTPQEAPGPRKPRHRTRKYRAMLSSDKQERADARQLLEEPELLKRLVQLLKLNRLKCIVCISTITRRHRVWSCPKCYSITHLKCTQEWFDTNTDDVDSPWTCPSCASSCPPPHGPIPYTCWCGSTTNPEPQASDVPHTCLRECNKSTRPCTHPCPLICHPGPCPPCVYKGEPNPCFCGKKIHQDLCCNTKPWSCQGSCDKMLKCNRHRCKEECHDGECGQCRADVERVCPCGALDLIQTCGDVEDPYGTCGGVCGRMLDCGNHTCTSICHKGPCRKCQLKPTIATTCPCGRRPLEALGVVRTACTDPFPTCGKICEKMLSCQEHLCQSECHEGPCPPCTVEMRKVCACGRTALLFPCSDTGKNEVCTKTCGRMMSCKRHTCRVVCCPQYRLGLRGHRCAEICRKPLKCGRHDCERSCHDGPCPVCHLTLNYLVSCACGNAVKHPPVECSSPLPVCKLKCSKTRSCNHPCFAVCHSGKCPPCAEPVSKSCVCGATSRIVPCLTPSNSVTCTTRCPLPREGCHHLCDTPCHPPGACPPACAKMCRKPRTTCDHFCTTPCHGYSECPDLPCRIGITIKCPCGRRKEETVCGAWSDAAPPVMYDCDARCVEAERKRVLDEAFLTEINDTVKDIYEPGMMAWLNAYPEEVEATEQQLLDNLRPQISARLTPAHFQTRHWQMVYAAKHFRFDVNPGWETDDRVGVMFSRHMTRKPNPLLSESKTTDAVQLDKMPPYITISDVPASFNETKIITILSKHRYDVSMAWKATPLHRVGDVQDGWSYARHDSTTLKVLFADPETAKLSYQLLLSNDEVPASTELYFAE